MTQQLGGFDILLVTSPIFIVIALGYGAVRGGLLPGTAVNVMGTYVLYFALPSLIFRALSQRSLAEIVSAPYLLAYGAGSLLVFGLTLLVGFRLRRKGLSEAVVLALGSSMSNSAFVGLPILLQLVGPAVLVPFALTLIVENALMMPLMVALAESGRNRDSGFAGALLKTLRHLLMHPIIISIALGLLFGVLGWHLPAPLTRVIDLFAASAGAVALLVIGGSLVGVRVGGMVTDLIQILLGKLLLHPLAVLGVSLLLGPMDPVYQVVAVGLACMPMAGVYPVLGYRYGMQGICAGALLAATAVSFGSITLWFWGLSHFVPLAS